MKRLSILVFFIYVGTAEAYPYFFLPNDAQLKARMHCQLMHYTINDPRPITSFLLNYMVNYEPQQQITIDETRLGILWDGAGTAPDMGFVIGSRWGSITRADRKEYNREFTLMLDRKYQFYNDMSYFKNCMMKIKSYEKNDNVEKITISTTIENREDKELAVLYMLEKTAPSHWHIVDMEINGDKIKKQFQDKFNEILSTRGVKGMIKYIKEQ